MDDDIDAGIRDLLREPATASASAQQRAISFAATRLEHDMAEIARLRRGDHRRRLGRALVTIFLVLLCAIGIATTVDSDFLGDVLGKETTWLDPATPTSTVSQTIRALERPDGTLVPDEMWAGLQQVAGVLSAGSAPLDRDHARDLLTYDEPGMQVRIAAAQTSNGHACFVARGAIVNRGCTSGFDKQRPLVAQLVRQGDRQGVVGLAADEVRNVTIRTHDGNRTAVLRNNAFFWVAEHAPDAPLGVTAELADGTRIDVHIANAPAKLG
jgi:hypothetical protein